MTTNDDLRRRLAGATKANRLLITHVPAERRSLNIMVSRGVAVQPIPGAFALKSGYEQMNPRVRERARIKAIHSLHPNWTFCLYSAAVAHGLQVPHVLLDASHIAIPKGCNWKKARDTVRSHVLHDSATVITDGVPCTNIKATVLECLCDADFRSGLAIVDSALHNGLVSLDELVRYFDEHARYRHGFRHARTTLSHADGRSENGGESVVRAIILELGFIAPELQVEVEDPLNPGSNKRVDFYWLLEDGRIIIGELDGLDKYLKVGKQGASSEDVLAAVRAMRKERLRETSLNLANMTVLRFSYQDALNTDKFFKLLSTVGVPLRNS